MLFETVSEFISKKNPRLKPGANNKMKCLELVHRRESIGYKLIDLVFDQLAVNDPRFFGKHVSGWSNLRGV